MIQTHGLIYLWPDLVLSYRLKWNRFGKSKYLHNEKYLPTLEQVRSRKKMLMVPKIGFLARNFVSILPIIENFTIANVIDSACVSIDETCWITEFANVFIRFSSKIIWNCKDIGGATTEGLS